MVMAMAVISVLSRHFSFFIDISCPFLNGEKINPNSSMCMLWWSGVGYATQINCNPNMNNQSDKREWFWSKRIKHDEAHAEVASLWERCSAAITLAAHSHALEKLPLDCSCWFAIQLLASYSLKDTLQVEGTLSNLFVEWCEIGGSSTVAPFPDPFGLKPS